MKYVYSVLLMAALSMLAGGDSGAVPQAGAMSSVCEAMVKNGASKEELAQQACCVYNRGVCGCRAGRIVCCDMTFSTNCGC